MNKERGYSLLLINEGDDEGLAKNLENDGFKVLVAKNCTEAVRILNIKKPKMIILDINTQEFGLEALKEVRNNKDLNIVSVIVLSSFSDVQEKVEWLELGANDYLDKPYNYNELSSRINHHLKMYSYYSEIMDQNEVLRATSVIDEVTGLFNRRYLMSRIIGEVSRAVREGSSLSFVIIGIDDFENIVSKYGDEAKDFILKQVAFMIRQVVRLSDIVIRYGASQLAVLCPITDRAGLDTFVERLRQMIEKSIFEYDGYSIRCTVSIGAYTLGSSDFNTFEKKVNNMFAFAEEALNRAKKNNGNRVEFFD